MEKINSISKDIISSSTKIKLQRRSDWNKLIAAAINDPEKVEASDREIIFIVNAKHLAYTLVQGSTIGTIAYHGYKRFAMTPSFWGQAIFSMYIFIPVFSHFQHLKSHNLHLKDILSYKYKHLLIND